MTANLLAVAGVLLAVSLAPSIVAAQEGRGQFGPGDDDVQQKLLTPGGADRWPLLVAVDEQLWCEVASDQFDPILDLVDAAGHTLASDDGVGTRSSLWHRVAVAGECAFVVRPFQGSGGGHYTLRLQRFRTEPLAKESEAAHTFDATGWWHYRVALQAGDLLVPTVLGEGRLDAVLTDQRVPVAGNLAGYNAGVTGDYFVRIRGTPGRRCQVLSQCARQREVGAERVDDALRPHGRDVWRIAIAAGEAFVLDLAMPDRVVANELVETAPVPHEPAFVATGEIDKGGRSRRFYVARRTTTLALHLGGEAAMPIPYSLQVRRGARSVAVGEAIDDSLPLGEGRLFELALTAGEVLHVELGSAAFDARFDVWAPSGDVIARADDRGPLDRDAALELLVPANGVYRLLAYAAGGAGAGPFRLATRAVAVPVLQPGNAIDVALREGEPSCVHLDLAAGQECWLAVASRACDAALTVLDPAGDRGFVAEGGGVDGNVLVAYRARHTGRHTLLVDSRCGSGAATVRALLP